MTTQEQTQGLGEFGRRGFTLYCPDDHIVALLHEGRRVGLFSQTGATEKSLQRECALHLVKCHGREGCFWTRKAEGNQRK